MRMRRSLLLCGVILLPLAGCNDKSSSAVGAAAPFNESMRAKLAAEPGGAGGLPAVSAEYASRAHLAYQHNMTLEMPFASIKPRFERARDACLNDVQYKCTLLQGAISTGEADSGIYPSTSLSVRLPHDQVQIYVKDLMSPLPGEGANDVSVRALSTSAEDLTRVIADTERRETELTSYRDSLIDLSKRKDAKIEDLIKVQAELAKTQTELEEIQSSKNNLNERVATESLEVSFISRPNVSGALRPVAEAWRSAGAELGSSAGSALRFTIAALPWLPVLAVFLYLARFVYRRWRR